MADPQLSSQSGPYNVVYEVVNTVIPSETIPPQEAGNTEQEVDNKLGAGYENKQEAVLPPLESKQEEYKQQASGFPKRSPSESAPQTTGFHARNTNSAAIPQQPIHSTPIAIPQQPIHSTPIAIAWPGYAESETGSGYFNNAAGAPQYGTPLPGYNPNQLYGADQALYTKHEFYNNTGVDSSLIPVEQPDESRRKKRICGMTVTAFSLMCVVLFVVIAGAVLGGIFGSGVLVKEHSDPTEDPNSLVSPTPTTQISTSSLPTTSAPTTTTTNEYEFPLPTGTWDLSGVLKITNGSCISDLQSQTYQEVWYCAENATQTVLVESYGTRTQLRYTVSLDTPTRQRGIEGQPPTSTTPMWAFTIPYTKQAFEGGTQCSVNAELTIFLGNKKSLYAWAENVINPDSCLLPNGLTSPAELHCGCGYMPLSLVSS